MAQESNVPLMGLNSDVGSFVLLVIITETASDVLITIVSSCILTAVKISLTIFLYVRFDECPFKLWNRRFLIQTIRKSSSLFMCLCPVIGGFALLARPILTAIYTGRAVLLPLNMRRLLILNISISTVTSTTIIPIVVMASYLLVQFDISYENAIQFRYFERETRS